MKKLITILLCALAALCFCALAACETTPDLPIEQSDITMTVSATDTDITISLESSVTATENTCKVVSVAAWQYLEGDSLCGLSEGIVAVDDATVVGEYVVGSEKTITLARYSSDNYDAIYNKYYVVASDGTIEKGPVYTTTIAEQVSETPALNIRSKKGLFGECDSDCFEDLCASYVTVNFEISEFIYPNEIDGVVLPAPTSDVISYISNGKTYYFRESVVEEFDELVSRYYNLGAHVTAVIIAKNNSDASAFPQQMTYPYSTVGTHYMALNTSNQFGFEYYIAMMEFLADRYTQNSYANGYIGNFVIGNEVDYAKDYNRISENNVSLNVYMEEYSRLLRLANLAAKKFHSEITVTMPTTQWWSRNGYDVGVGSYAPKDMIEWLNAKTKSEGDYDWCIAPHFYTYGLANSDVYLMDTVEGAKKGENGDYNTSSLLTFSNLEILQQFLDQEKMKVNGNVRKVYSTEAGCSSYAGSDDEAQILLNQQRQAAYVASTWYKVSQLDCIVAYSYYRVYDSVNDGGNLECGLFTADGEKKLAYTVWKYIDTNMGEEIAAEYLQYIAYKDVDGVMRGYGTENTIESYMDVLDIFGTGYDFSKFDWTKAAPRELNILLEKTAFEDQIFFADGTAHSLTAEVPDGMEVSYDGNAQTVVGVYDVVATFTKDGELVGTKTATMTILPVSINKTVYKYGEKVFVTTSKDLGDNLTDGNGNTIAIDDYAWVGVFRSNASIGTDCSLFWYYFNTRSEETIKTVNINDSTWFNADYGTELTTLPAGHYKLVYFIDGGYVYSASCNSKKIAFMIEFEVLDEGEETDSIDLSDISFADKTATADGTEQCIEIEGSLPEGVTVVYQNNTLTEGGSATACAIFMYQGEEIERRYALFVLNSQEDIVFTTDKTSYVAGENVLVTATAPITSANQQWWVGLYLKGDLYGSGEGTVTSIYWYYVKDAEHTSGETYVIQQQSGNSDRSDLWGIPAGEYVLYLFGTSGYDTVIATAEFTVTAAATNEASLALNKAEFYVGEEILVTATVPESSATCWVGLYLKGDLYGSGEGTVTSIYWYYVKDDNHASGQSYVLQQQEANSDRADYANIPAGEYILYLFGTGGYDTVLAQAEFTVTEATITQTTITLNKTQFDNGEDILATVTIASGDVKTYWVGVYLKGDLVENGKMPSIRYYYVGTAPENTSEVYAASGAAFDVHDGKDNGRTALSALPVGRYKLVLFDSNGYTVAQTLYFQVGTDEQLPIEGTITLAQTDFKQGDTITVNVVTSCTEANSAWVGVYNASDDISSKTVASLAYFYVQSDCTVYTLDTSALSAGEYELVLYLDGQYTVECIVCFTITEAEA